MIIKVESRYSIEKRAKELFQANTAVISIADIDCDFAKLENNPDYLLQINIFDDVNVTLEQIAEWFRANKKVYKDRRRVKPTKKEALEMAEKWKNRNMFKYKQAVEIAEFIMPILGEAELLICQCDVEWDDKYPYSMSLAVAAAVRKFLYDDIEIFLRPANIEQFFYDDDIRTFKTNEDERCYPNRLVYGYVKQALEQQKYNEEHKHDRELDLAKFLRK